MLTKPLQIIYLTLSENLICLNMLMPGQKVHRILNDISLGVKVFNNYFRPLGVICYQQDRQLLIYEKTAKQEEK